MVFRRRGFLGGHPRRRVPASWGSCSPSPSCARSGPTPKKTFDTTDWTAGRYLVDIDGQPHPPGRPRGGRRRSPSSPRASRAPPSARPDHPHPARERADIVTMPGPRDVGARGVRGLLQGVHPRRLPGRPLPGAATQQLLCPCHQSLFDVMTGAEPVFGPAPRPLPQLPLTIDNDGFLVAQSRLRPARRARVLGAVMSATTSTGVTATSANGSANGKRVTKNEPVDGGRPVARRPPRRGQGRPDAARQDLPRPLVVPARGDRPLLVRRAHRHRRLPVACTSSPRPPRSSTPGPTCRCGHHRCPPPTRRRWTSPSPCAAVSSSARCTTGPPTSSSGAIAVHMARIFFTGAFRKPRELNWIIGVTLLILAIVNGLPRLLAARRPGVGDGHAHRATRSSCRSPWSGSYLATFVFGGNFPGDGLDHPPLLHPPRPHHAARSSSGSRRPPRAAGEAEAHPVPRAWPHREERGGHRPCTRPSS